MGILPALFIFSAFHYFASAQATEDKESRINPPQAQYTANGVEGCLACHQGEHMTLMAKTVHGNSDNPHTPYATQGCESCHGPGSFHSSRARGGIGFPALVSFRPGNEEKHEQNQACTSCHGKDLGELKGKQWEGSLHQNLGMTCSNCHEVHVANDRMKDQEIQRAQCGQCHRGQIEGHFENLPCSSCHDVHELTRKDSEPLTATSSTVNNPQPTGSSPADDDPRIESWAEDWPDYVEMYLETKDMSKPTPFGGNVPYSKLIRFPGKTALWAGYAFAVDFNEDRGHYFTQIDQMKTKRNDREYLNAHGLPNFRGQPGSCMNCHSGWAPILVDQMGWEDFNRTPYWTTIEKLQTDHGHSETSGAQLGSSCNDCHDPNDMGLRINRRAFIDAMVARGYEADPVKGLKGTQKEMRDHVCAQCHVEYYFQGENAILTFPWTEWPKDQPLKFEMVEEYYEKVRNKPDGFQHDWIHAVTKAPMLKMQHPEAEVVSSGVHANFIGCVDCHMPKVERNGKTMTDHTMGSPLNKLDSCLSCHSNMSEDQLYQRVYDLQVRNVDALLRAEKAILALIEDIAGVRQELAAKDPFAQIADEGEREAAITEELTDVLDFHRRSSMRWDWIGASNSTGAHSPAEALRVLEQAVAMAQDGQALLKEVAAQHDIDLIPTTQPTLPAPPEVINPGHIVGSEPPEITRKADQVVRDWNLP